MSPGRERPVCGAFRQPVCDRDNPKSKIQNAPAGNLHAMRRVYRADNNGAKNTIRAFGGKTMAKDTIPQAKPTGTDADFDNDLHPHNRAGQNNSSDRNEGRTAFVLKENESTLHARLQKLPDQELKQIPLLDTGTRLQEGAAYLDLRNLDGGAFQGMNNREVGANDAFTSKSHLDHEQFAYLTGATTVAQLGRFSRIAEGDILADNALPLDQEFQN